MTPQKEVSEAIHQHTDSDYGRYEGNETFSAHQQDETAYEQEARGEAFGKVYPLPRDRMKVFRFALPVISLVLLVLFALLFVVVIGGTAGWISFAAACFVLCCVMAYTWSISQTGE